ncbi:MAG: DUF6503 family protein [Thermoanaerobaculia bacterium]
MRCVLLALPTLLVATAALTAADLPTGPELLERSNAYHDPTGAWGRTALALIIEERRPDGTVRETGVAIDLEREIFTWVSQREGHDLVGKLRGERCELYLDGKSDFSEQEAEELGLNCDRVIWFRDYYTFLYGLPMKLRDPGTLVGDKVAATEFEGHEVLSLRVTYEADVGADTWYLYFDPASSALAGYRFYHDEAKNDGEYITLEGEVELGGMKLPQTRAWYYNDGRGYLGTDTLVGNRSVAE